MTAEITLKQQEVCARFNAGYCACDLTLKVGIAQNALDGLRPLNGIRMRPENNTSGWYIWGGETFSEAPDFFQPLHGTHLSQWAPLVLPYLALPPGWRFLITERYEDVWEDSELLKEA